MYDWGLPRGWDHQLDVPEWPDDPLISVNVVAFLEARHGIPGANRTFHAYWEIIAQQHEHHEWTRDFIGPGDGGFRLCQGIEHVPGVRIEVIDHGAQWYREWTWKDLAYRIASGPTVHGLRVQDLELLRLDPPSLEKASKGELRGTLPDDPGVRSLQVVSLFVDATVVNTHSSRSCDRDETTATNPRRSAIAPIGAEIDGYLNTLAYVYERMYCGYGGRGRSDSPHAGLLASAAQHPERIRMMGNGDTPMCEAIGGYESRTSIGGPWYLTPVLGYQRNPVPGIPGPCVRLGARRLLNGCDPFPYMSVPLVRDPSTARDAR